MVDDIVEAVIDLLGDLLEIAISSKRGKRKRTERISEPAAASKPGKKQRAERKKQKTAQPYEPWERSDQAAPWEK